MSVLEVLTTPDERLRQKSRKLASEEVVSDGIKKLVADIRETLQSGEYGVGMSAVQVGAPVQVVVVMTRPTPNRPGLDRFEKNYFNVEIVKTYGEKTPMWEGCCSVLGNDKKPVYARVPRFKKIKVKYLDGEGQECEEDVEGFLAHVLQHEIDHARGVLFTDLVDASEIISYEEYHKIAMM